MKTISQLMSEVHEKPFLLDSENKQWIEAVQADARADLKELVTAWREQAINQYGGLPEFWFVLNSKTDDELAK